MDEVISPPLSKSEIKPLSRKNVIPITSISDLGGIVAEIQNQLGALIAKLDNDVSPEFKALMEGYVNKANETEELKVNLENTSSKHEELRGEVNKLRETNRNLIRELQNTRETLRNLENELNNFQDITKRNENDHRDKIRNLTKQNQEYETQVKALETKIVELKESQDSLKQEYSDQSFKYRRNEQELIIEKENFKKQVEEFEVLLTEQKEQIEFKTKEAEYKDALLNQLIKKTTTDRALAQEATDNTKEPEPKKKKGWFC